MEHFQVVDPEVNSTLNCFLRLNFFSWLTLVFTYSQLALYFEQEEERVLQQSLLILLALFLLLVFSDCCAAHLYKLYEREVPGRPGRSIYDVYRKYYSS